MTFFKIILRSGHAVAIEDKRTLAALATQLAQEGFIVVERRASAYSETTVELALMERAVESIEEVR